MSKSFFQPIIKLTQTQVDAGATNAPAGAKILVIDGTGAFTGQAYEKTATTVLSVGGLKNNFAATTAPTATDDSGDGYAIGSRWIDTTGDESYICLDATLNNAVWSKTTVGTIAEVANLQATLDTKAPLASPTFTGTVSGVTKAMVGLGNADNTADTDKPVSTAQQTALNLKQDASTAATDAELSAHTGNVSNPHTVTKAQVGLGSVDNTTDLLKPISTATQSALDGKSATTHNHDTAYTAIAHGTNVSNPHSVTKTQVGLGSADNTADTAKPVSTAQQTALDAKQATLVSGINIKTVNGASILGSGGITVAADLAGGAAATAYDDGLNAGNAVIDRATVVGQTILKYETVGSSTFKVPTGVTAIDYLIVAGGGGGGKSIGAGGGAGGLLTATGYAVTPGATLAVSVGGGGAGATTTTAVGVNGTNSTLGSITSAVGGGGGTGQSVNFPSGPGGSLGGSGGGGARNNTTPGAGTTGQGFAGGSGSDTGNAYGGGGGGGAGGLGGNGSGTNGGNGGVGVSSSITGSAVFYAGGGGGGVNVGVSGLGGSNIGGNAGTGGSPGGDGTTKTGSGGGGSESTANAGSGGSGIIIVRFVTQTRSYQTLQSFASNAAALAGNLLVGQFFNNTTTGGIAQVI